MDSNTFLYEVAAIERPTGKAQESGAVARVVLAPTTVIASGRSAAIALASSKITATDWDAQRTTFLVRKFVGDSYAR